jgi:hypothetical protein
MTTIELAALISLILFFWIGFRGGQFGKDRLTVPTHGYRIQMNPFFTRISYETKTNEERSYIFWRSVEVIVVAEK